MFTSGRGLLIPIDITVFKEQSDRLGSMAMYGDMEIHVKESIRDIEKLLKPDNILTFHPALREGRPNAT